MFFATLLALSLPSVGCAALRAPLTAPEKGGSAWTEVTSPHFVLLTDAGPERARALAADFERMHAALAFVMQRPPGSSSARLEIVVFDRKEDFFEISGRDLAVGAYFMTLPPGDLEPQPMVVMPREELADDAKLTFQHELAHRFLHERFAALPTWLDEGLAQYFSSLRIDAGRAVLGGPIAVDFSDRPFFWTSWQGNSQQTQIPSYKAPKVAELVRADRTTFYGSAEHAVRSDEVLERQSIFYGAAWKLVHFFMNGPIPGSYARFSGYLAEVQRGARTPDPFSEAFGADLSGLEKAFHAYLLEAPLSLLTLDLPPTPPAQPGSATHVRTLRDAEVHVLWARLLPRAREKEFAERARRELDEALAREPGSPEVRYRKAITFFYDQRFDEAVREIDSALATRPEDPRYLYVRVSLLPKQRLQGTAKIKDREVSLDLVNRFVRAAVSAEQLQTAAWFVAQTGRSDEGLQLVERAISADPLSWICQMTRARLLLAGRKYDEALSAVGRARALLPERASDERLLWLQEEIVRARARAVQDATPLKN